MDFGEDSQGLAALRDCPQPDVRFGSIADIAGKSVMIGFSIADIVVRGRSH
jgi:hypothetical protein